MTALLGHNGSGKSTLMNLLARADRPDRGQITLDGRPLGSFTQRRWPGAWPICRSARPPCRA
ncbi:ATP-binding cassette domain-containing protein [Gemmobacter lanyuensis]